MYRPHLDHYTQCRSWKMKEEGTDDDSICGGLSKGCSAPLTGQDGCFRYIYFTFVDEEKVIL